MLGELRPIHFGTDLIFPPLNISTEVFLQKHRSRIKQVFDKVRSEKGIDFNKMDVDAPLGPHLWTRRPSGYMTSYSFLSDRIQARDEWTERTLDDFAREVREVVDVCFRVFNIPVVVMQSCVIRATAKPHGYDDSRDFLFDHGLNLSGERVTELFGRPAHVAGISITFPLLKDVPDEQRVRIESYAADPSLLFMEVHSIFRANPIPATNEAQLETNLKDCYDFMESRVRAFVDSLFEVKGEDTQ